MAKFSIFRLIFSKGQRRTKKPSLSIKSHAHNKRPTETGEPLLCQRALAFMAEKEGFEPSRQLSHPTPLAGEPLRPLGYFSMPVQFWRRERDSNPRCLSTSLVFKTSALNHSAISPQMKPRNLLYQNWRRLSTLLPKKGVYQIVELQYILDRGKEKGARLESRNLL